MKNLFFAISFIVSATAFSAELKNEKGSMDFPKLKIEKVEGATYIALSSNSGEAYIFGLANDVLLDVQKGISQEEVLGFYDSIEENKLDVELFDVSNSKGALTVKPTYEDFTINFTKDETAKIFKAVKGGK
ncbi:MAG: hypothetical protein ACRC0F_04320 [Cetobacterium sp.]